MKHRLLFKDSHIDINYNLDNDMILAQWHGKQDEETIKRGYKQVLDEISRHSVKTLLDNHQEISGLWAGAGDWIAKEWFTSAKSSGLLFMACVYSQHTFSRLSTIATIRLIDSSHVLGFDDSLVAAQWLEDMIHRG